MLYLLLIKLIFFFSDKNNLSFDCITIAMGIRYKSYCSNVVRTLLINPTKEQEEYYNFLLSTHEEVLNKLQHGVKLCDVFNSAVSFVEKSHKELIPKMLKNLGYVFKFFFSIGPTVVVVTRTSIFNSI